MMMTSKSKLNRFRFVSLKFIIFLLALTFIPAVAAFSSTRIMLVGDSITYGIGGTYGGYRGYLNDFLIFGGYDFDFVGSRTANSPAVIDPHHEGYPGWRAEEIRNNIHSWLISNPAELVLLHIGTNDIGGISDSLAEAQWKSQVNTQVAEVSQILDNIDGFSENTTVVLARIISRTDENQKTYTTYFNQKLQEMAQNRLDDDIIIVDMENSAGLVYSTEAGGDLADYLHPNDFGYEKMADLWYSAISSYEINPGCQLDSRFKIATLDTGLKYYTDRDYYLTYVPDSYKGMKTIRTPNDDRIRIDDSNYLKFQMLSDATVFVAFDRRATKLPNWLADFDDTGDIIQTSLSTQGNLKVYSKDFFKGDCVDLGGNYAPYSSTEERSNYIVFYGTIGSSPPCVLASKFQKTSLAPNIRYYTDRTYTIQSVPPEYIGLDLIKTPNDDLSAATPTGYMKFSMPVNGKVFVAYDRRVTKLPNWMNGFSYTQKNIYTSLSTQGYLKIYSKAYNLGDCVDLGGNYAPDSSSEDRSNYIVFYGVEGETPPPPSDCLLDDNFQETKIAVGARYYTDRDYSITGGIPDWMVGRTLIQTPNDERLDASNDGYLSFTNPVDWWVYVLFDSRSASIPNWLSGWELRSDIMIKTSLSTQPYLKVYRKQFDAGQCVDLGGNYGDGSSTEDRSNYVVVFGQ